MRIAIISITLTLGLAACIDFGLSDRRYRCDNDPEICGEGWVCNDEGFCAEAGDAAASRIDGSSPPADAETSQPDAQVCEPGANECDDGNLCTNSHCSPTESVCKHPERRCERSGFECCPEDGVCRAGC